MPRACLMGHPVAHSRSPLIHRYWLETLGIAGSYELEDLAPEEFPGFVTRLPEHGYVGGNVTLPHKEAAFRLAARRDAAAQAIGAVNTLWLEDGLLVGGNSDASGFIANLDERAPRWDAAGCKALVLGAGGAARAVVYALAARRVEVAIANRTVERARELAQRFGPTVRALRFDELPERLADSDLLVNCTSLGMAGKPALEVDLAPLKRAAVVCDTVYAPLETGLLAQARARGLRAVDGLGMLLHQAVYGFRKWFGGVPTVTAELRALIEADLRSQGPADRNA